ncbi:hypothetical protein ACHAQD_003575 [Fusarium lateritium]
MCRLVELEYACSTDDKPHRLRTEAILPCNDPLGCLAEEIVLHKPGSEASLATAESQEQEFAIMKIGGDCEKCAERKTNILVNEERIYLDIKEELEEMGGKLKCPVSKRMRRSRHMQRSDGSISLYKVREPRAKYQPEAICSSGSCTGPVCVAHDGRRGMFCEEHTCSAVDYNCLSDVSTTRNSSQYSIYCPLHTCSRLGCGLKVTNQETVLCKRHDKLFEVATWTQRYAKQGGGYGQSPFGILDSQTRRR